MQSNEQRVYRFEEGIKIERELEEKGYIYVNCRSIKGKESYFIKPYLHESPRHAVLVFEIIEYLKDYTKRIKQYLSRRPDIVFKLKNKEYAVEVETGTILKRNKEQLLGKIANLKYSYGRNWFFVVTDRNLVKSYKRYGKTYTKRNIFQKINKLVMENNARNSKKKLSVRNEDYY